MEYDVIIIGGGPAGLAAALGAREGGAKSILVIERDRALGGILNQCVHNGFGLHYFGEDLTGPEYAGRFIDRLDAAQIQVSADTMVLEITRDRTVRCVGAATGYRELRARAIVLCMGCRERARGAIQLPGDRPAGVFTAGVVQRYINMEGYLVGRRAVILGSGDIGLIMARRMTLEGADVLACVELMPYSTGLTRNVVQCLHDYGIPLYLSHTVTKIIGKERVERVLISRVDRSRQPVPGTEIELACDTVVLSVGLIPENELTRGARADIDPRTGGAAVFENMETSAEGIFAAGNVVHVHDLVDNVTEEGCRAGMAAARFALGERTEGGALAVKNGPGVTYVVPQRIRQKNVPQSAPLFFRVDGVYMNAEVRVMDGGRCLLSFQREFLTPGEMQKLRLPGKLLEGVVSGALEIRVEGREETAG